MVVFDRYNYYTGAPIDSCKLVPLRAVLYCSGSYVVTKLRSLSDFLLGLNESILTRNLVANWSVVNSSLGNSCHIHIYIYIYIYVCVCVYT